MPMMFDPGACCGCGIPVTIRVNKCGSVALPDAVVLIKDGSGTIVGSGVTGVGGTVSLTIPAGGSYTVEATDSGGVAVGTGTFTMGSGGTYTVVVAVNPADDRFLLSYLSCGSVSRTRMIRTYTNAADAGYVSPYYYYTPTGGGTPSVSIVDPQGKFKSKTVTGAMDCTQQTTGVLMEFEAGWECACLVDDGVGRSSVLVETPAGSFVLANPISNGTIITSMSADNALTSESDAADCGTRIVPTFGTGPVAIGWGFNTCSNPPTATQGLWYQQYTWNDGCPKSAANQQTHWYRLATVAGLNPKEFDADSYTINSTTSPASITFTWGAGSGDFKPVPGSITITEIM